MKKYKIDIKLQEVLSLFELGKLCGYEKLDGGIINKTYFVESNKGEFVIQRLSKIFNEFVVEDHLFLQKFFAQDKFLIPMIPKIFSAQNGLFYWKDRQKYIWRVSEFIEHEEVTEKSPELIYEAGKALGECHKLLKKVDYIPRFKIEGFHDTPRIIEKLRDVFAKQSFKEWELDYHGRAYHVDSEFEFIVKNIEKFYLSNDCEKQLIHGDPKFSNFLFRGGKVIAMIDWDTLMFSSLFIDIGDALRSWCKNLDGSFNKEIFDAAIKGYLENESQNICNFKNAMFLITLELAARYLIDYFEEKYFQWDKEKYESAAEHNLSRCKRELNFFRQAEKILSKK